MGDIIPFPEQGDFSAQSRLYNPDLVNRYLESFSGIDRLLIASQCAYLAEKLDRPITIFDLNAAVQIAHVLDVCVQTGSLELTAKSLGFPALCATELRDYFEQYLSQSHDVGDSFVEGLRISLLYARADDASFVASHLGQNEVSAEDIAKHCPTVKGRKALTSRNMFHYAGQSATKER